MRLMTRVSVGAGLLGSVAAAALLYWPDAPDFRPVETSESSEFQDQDASDGFARIEPPLAQAEEEPVEPVFDTSALEAEFAVDRARLEDQNQALERSVEDLQAQLEAILAADDDAAAAALAEIRSQNASLLETIAGLQTQLGDADATLQETLAAERQRADEALQMLRLEMEEERATQLADRTAEQERQRAATAQQMREAHRREQALLDRLAGLEMQIENGLNEGLLEAELERQRLAQEEALEAEREAELRQRHQDALALQNAQIRSVGVIFDAGVSSPSSSSVASGVSEANGEFAERQFIAEGAASVAVMQSEIIADPSITIIQGTIIEATLETGLDSSLPGQVVAVVNRPVYSFDGSQVLIPPGTRLFGQYDSNVSLGQRRVLVGWKRLVTPDGQSVAMAAFGADDQGRSGLTGTVNNRFGLRFGSAALLSVIGTASGLAASQASSAEGAELAEDVATNFEQTTQSVIGQYAALPPVISLQPGSAVIVIVERDIEFMR